MRVTFNYDEVSKNMKKAFDPLPNGQYDVQITNVQLKENKAKTGTYYSIEFSVLDGEYDGRKLWHMYTITNPNEQAVKIGEENLVRTAQATGMTSFTDTDELIGRSLRVTVDLEKSKDTSFPDRNKITRFDKSDTIPF